MRAITDAGGEHQCFDKLTEYRNAVDPVSSVELPGTESMAWLFDKHPPLATALNMIYAERCLQAKLSAAYMAWTTKDMHADVFLCDGYGKQLEELGAALTDAKRFKDGANEVILKLRGAADVAELKDCVELAKFLMPTVKNFLSILSDCEALYETLHKCAVAKGTSLLAAQGLLTKDWQPDYRIWMGVDNASQRHNKSIKTHMLGKGEGKHTETGKKLDTFEIIIGKVEAAKKLLPELTPAIKTAQDLLHDGRFYCCAAGVVYNVHVKKLQKTPAELLKSACKVVARGARSRKLWGPRADGRGSSPKDSNTVLSNCS